MAIGFIPKHSETYPLADLSPAQFLVLALAAGERLGWRIGYVSDTGFVAYTSRGIMMRNAEVRILISDTAATIKSASIGNEMIDWGRNKKNIAGFISELNELKISMGSDAIAARYERLREQLPAPEQDKLRLPPPTARERAGGFFSLFIPAKGYTITPLLVLANIAVFVLMALNGVSIFEPTNEGILKWGANFRPLTLEGEWWRLVSNYFIHIGLLHLLFNMYALVYIGLLLEPYLGKARFLAAYMLAGIAASVVSLWWHPDTISAGASGAIFGMYGVFLALLTTNLIEKATRSALLTSIAVFVGYNLLNGMKGGVDNAAHLGGLLCGVVTGYAFIPGLKRPQAGGLKWSVIGAMSILVLAGTAYALRTIPDDYGRYEAMMKQLDAMQAAALAAENKAIDMYKLQSDRSADNAITILENESLPAWNKGKGYAADAGRLQLPASAQSRNKKLEYYFDLHAQYTTLLQKVMAHNTNQYDDEITSLKELNEEK